MRISIPPQRRLRRSLALASIATLALVPAAQAGSGGVGSGGGGGCNADAKIVKGNRAVAPDCAPRAVKEAIAGANEIRKKPYKYGGGHGSWHDSGYDCSGSVSYALHKAGLLRSPLDSSGLARWAAKGKGHWISVFGNSGHAYAVIAGLRWDTSMTPGDGPGWSNEMRSSSGFAKRHKSGL